MIVIDLFIYYRSKLFEPPLDGPGILMARQLSESASDQKRDGVQEQRQQKGREKAIKRDDNAQFQSFYSLQWLSHHEMVFRIDSSAVPLEGILVGG